MVPSLRACTKLGCPKSPSSMVATCSPAAMGELVCKRISMRLKNGDIHCMYVEGASIFWAICDSGLVMSSSMTSERRGGSPMWKNLTL